MAITGETLIGTLVEEHPEVLDTLLSYGVHCVGCHVSPYEPLAEGFRGHGMSEPEIEEALAKLNSVIVIKTPAAVLTTSIPNISITPDAWGKIKEICTKKNKQAIRLAIKAGGCSGFKYVFELSDQQQENDVVIEHQDAKVYLDKTSLERIAGSTIDYEDGLQGAGFRVHNPQVKTSCGCGNSFR